METKNLRRGYQLESDLVKASYDSKVTYRRNEPINIIEHEEMGLQSCHMLMTERWSL